LCFVAPPNCRLSAHLKKEEQEELLKKMEALTEAKLGMGSVVMTGRKRGREDGGENVLQSEQQQQQKGLLSQQSTKKKPLLLQQWVDPVQGMANVRHEFGEHGGVNMSIEASTTFTVLEPETMSKLFQGALGPDRDFYIYSRHFNPTVLNLSRQMAAMEGTEAAYCTSSGMSAISGILMQLCSSGDHIIASSRLYGGTHALLAHFLPRTSNITTTFVDIEDLDAVREALKKAPGSTTKVLYFESMSNPQLTVADIPALSGIGHDKGLTVVVDNTFAPLSLSPAHLGADVVVHSMSKFICGASDIIAGAVCGPADLVNSMMDLKQGSLMLLGPTMNPQIAFQISLRLPHLGIRMKEHCERALIYAQRLKKLGLKVIYPGLPDHPQHELMKTLVNDGYGYGGVLSVDLETTERAHDLMRHLQNTSQFGWMAVSLGYHDTLMSCSGSTTSSELSKEEQATAGISAGLVRMSIGFTGSMEKRWSQLLDALTSLKLVPDVAARWQD
jgi:methionine-gamma-lyase